MSERRHPSPDALWDWITVGRDPEASVAAHVDACEKCRGVISTLEKLWQAGRDAAWADAPASVVKRAFEVEEKPAPAPAPRRGRVDWIPADVRGGVVDPASPRVATESFGDVRVSVVASPRLGDMSWEIRGKIWSDGPGPIRVLLVHGEHVLAQAEVAGSGDFAFDEPAAGGWSVEIHRGEKETWVLEDPSA